MKITNHTINQYKLKILPITKCQPTLSNNLSLSLIQNMSEIYIT